LILSLDVDRRHPASKFLLHVLAEPAEFERFNDFWNVQRQVCASPGRNTSRVLYVKPYTADLVDIYRRTVRRRFSIVRDSVLKLRGQGLSLRKIAARLGIGLGTGVRSLHERSKSS